MVKMGLVSVVTREDESTGTETLYSTEKVCIMNLLPVISVTLPFLEQ